MSERDTQFSGSMLNHKFWYSEEAPSLLRERLSKPRGECLSHLGIVEDIEVQFERAYPVTNGTCLTLGAVPLMQTKPIKPVLKLELRSSHLWNGAFQLICLQLTTDRPPLEGTAKPTQ